MKLQSRIGYLALLLVPLLAWADPPPALNPRANVTGFSNVEQRYVYGQPDEGEFDVELRLGSAAAREMVIAEPSMCAGSASARVRYSKARNKVTVETRFHGLPYRMNLTRPDDMSTPYNQFPVSVENGKWQLWFVGRMFNFRTLFYYDVFTGKLIGNEADLPNGPPPGSFAVPINTLHMTSGPIFEGNPDGDARVTFEFNYDRMIDTDGRGGVWYAQLPYDLCKPDEYGHYYINGGLPPEKAFSFDQVLESIHQGFGMALAFSLEPDPKPSYLISRDNPAIGWAGGYPPRTPAGVVSNPIDGTLSVRTQCGGTHVNRPFAKSFYNLCAGR
jgi:hypothetical protein